MSGKDHANLPYDLENMSIPELEALLQQDFIASSGDAPDVEYIMKIVEVIQQKETEAPDYQPIDTEQAWNKFQTFYNTEEDSAYAFYPPDEEIRDTTASVAAPTKKRKKYRVPLLAAAIVLLVSLTCVPILGYANVLQMVAQLSNDKFWFAPDVSVPGSGQSNATDGSAVEIANSFATMQEALDAYEIRAQVFPKVLSEDYVQLELKVNDYPTSNKAEFYGHYQNNSREINFSITNRLKQNSKTYESNSDIQPEVYAINGTDYYIFENLDQISIAWYSGTLECSIKGDLSLDEAKDMIDSIY